MAHGFPDGQFRIINVDTGLCLAALHGGESGGVGTEVDRLTGTKYSVEYTHTNDQVLGVVEPTGENREIWFLDNSKNSWGAELWHLVNINKDIRSSFALHASSRNPGPPLPLELRGRGLPDQSQWESWAHPDGNEFCPVPQGPPARIVGLQQTEDGGYVAVLSSSGVTPHQKWRYDPA